MGKVTQADRETLAQLGYTVVDARNPVVESGWLMRAPGIEDRAWVAATEEDAWQAAYEHSQPARTNNHAELLEALRDSVLSAIEDVIARYTGDRRSDDDIRFALNTAKTAARKALSLYGGEKP